jgi:hypothetical protein
VLLKIGAFDALLRPRAVRRKTPCHDQRGCRHDSGRLDMNPLFHA